MKIIKKTSRKIGTVREYKGVCEGCGAELEYLDELIVIEIGLDDEKAMLVPIDRLICSSCNHEISILKLYRSMEISGELEIIKHESNH